MYTLKQLIKLNHFGFNDIETAQILNIVEEWLLSHRSQITEDSNKNDYDCTKEVLTINHLIKGLAPN